MSTVLGIALQKYNVFNDNMNDILSSSRINNNFTELAILNIPNISTQLKCINKAFKSYIQSSYNNQLNSTIIINEYIKPNITILNLYNYVLKNHKESYFNKHDVYNAIDFYNSTLSMFYEQLHMCINTMMQNI